MEPVVGVTCNAIRPLGLGCLVAALLTTTGCGWWNSDGPSDADDSLPQLDFVTDEPAGASEETGLTRTGIQPGERFGFRKTVEQTLTQDLATGLISSRSLLEVEFDLSVESVDAGRNQFRVLYHRVRYTQEFPGRRVEYDSEETPGGELPAEVRLYHGLVDNGFAFSVPSNGAAVELIGVNEFVERCIRHLPHEDREASRQYLASTWTAGMASELVGETVRLIPTDVDLFAGEDSTQIGHQWTQQRAQPQPVPMTLSTTATLRRLEDQTAEIDVTGRIASMSSVVPAAAQSDVVRTSVRGGECSGSYTVDRRTRLPVRALLEQTFDMQVVASGGESFEQQKHVVTKIEAIPAADATTLAPQAQGRPRPVLPAVPIDASNHTLRSASSVQRR